MQSDEKIIDELTAQFFDAFTNSGGAAPDVDRLYRLFDRTARIVNYAGADPQIYDVAGFIEPRRTILNDGSVREFREEETAANTDVFKNIAHRFSRYRKSWVASGERYEGEGAKSLQFVRTPEGWKISSLIWDDV